MSMVHLANEHVILSNEHGILANEHDIDESFIIIIVVEKNIYI